MSLITDLKPNAATIKRLRHLLSRVKGKGTATWDRLELDDACGLPNKPLGRLLRTCFIKADGYAPRSGKSNVYVVWPVAIEEVQEVVDRHKQREIQG